MSVRNEHSFTCGGGASLVLQGDQREVDTFPPQELAVGPSLHRLPVLKAHNHVCVPDGGEAVGDGNGGPASAHLHSSRVTEVWLSISAQISSCVSHLVQGFLDHSLALVVQG